MILSLTSQEYSILSTSVVLLLPKLNLKMFFVETIHLLVSLFLAILSFVRPLKYDIYFHYMFKLAIIYTFFPIIYALCALKWDTRERSQAGYCCSFLFLVSSQAVLKPADLVPQLSCKESPVSTTQFQNSSAGSRMVSLSVGIIVKSKFVFMLFFLRAKQWRCLGLKLEFDLIKSPH